MQYKTIILELLRQNTKLHEQLRQSDTLLDTMNEQALQLRARHQEWMAVLSEATPGSEALPAWSLTEPCKVKGS